MTKVWSSFQSTLEARPWLVLVVAAAIAIPTLVLGEIAAADTRSRLRDAQLQAQDAAAVRSAKRASFILGDVADHLAEATAANSPLVAAVSAGDRKGIQAALTDLASRFTYTPGYYLVDTKGVIVAGSTSGASTGPLARVIGRRAPTLAWFDSPLSRLGTQFLASDEMTRIFSRPDLYFTDLFVPSDRSGHPMALGTSVGDERPGEERLGYRSAMAIRVIDRSGRFAGALVAEIDISPFVDAIFELQGIAAHAYLIDGNGRVVRRMQYIDREFVGTDLSSSAAIRAVFAGTKLAGEGADPYTGEEALLSSIPVPSMSGDFGVDLPIRWTVIAAEPLAQLYAEVDAGASSLRVIRVALVLIIVGFAGLLTIAVRSVVRHRGELASANRALARTSDELAAATRHKSEFLANMSHELRTPLNSIIGFADILQQSLFGDLNAKQAEYVGDISGSGRHLLSLVNDILDLSKVEAGRMELELSDFSIAEMIRTTLMFVQERAASRAIQLSADIEPEIGTASGDERKVRQVLLNLLSNAIKFTPAGGSIRLAARREGGDLRISVSDTGIGIAREDLDKVFEEFRQVGAASARPQEGTGLGLALAKRFVELHGGRIWLESTPGHGTTFTFSLPILHASATLVTA